MSKPLRILLVEDNPGDADLIQEMLPAGEDPEFTVHCVTRLADAVSHLRKKETDLALLDLDLPDSNGLETVRIARKAAPRMPIVVLTGNHDEQIGIAAVQGGAQDFLIKGQTQSNHLARVIRYAFERHCAEEQIRESERFLRSALDALSAHIAIIDASGRVLAANKAWKEFAAQHCQHSMRCGENTDYFAAQKTFRFESSKDAGYAESFADGIRDVLDNAKDIFEMEYSLCCGSLEKFWFHGRITPFPGVGERRVVVAHENITERRRAIEEKMRLAAQLRHSYKMEAIGTLAGGIAHDFNNILSSVIGFTELCLLDVNKGSLLESNMMEVYQAGMRARDLVRQILTFARKDENHILPTQVSTIAKEASKLIRSIIPASIDIRLQVESEALVMADPSQIHQIFMNLFTNAAQAMEADGGKLAIRISQARLDRYFDSMHKRFVPGDFLKITVEDTGIGIDPEKLDKIFDPYYTTKGRGEGTGLGLSVVHGIVQACNGEIEVESEPGRGTAFTIYLPIVAQHATAATDMPSRLPLGTERILFIDDERPIANMSRQRLNLLGYRVTVANSSLEALDRLAAGPEDFDLIITDMSMPQMSGDRLAIEAKKLSPNVPIILCTGYSKKISPEKAAAIGIDAFIMKPMAVNEMAETIRKVLDAKSK
jgi:signal transduction histidine kinase/DNA-binding response OmpR family regulator